MPREIEFFGPGDVYGFLSNFYHAPFFLDGKRWPTVEHYFQAAKFPAHPDYQERVRRAQTPAAAKRLGRTRNFNIRQDWNCQRNEIMRAALRAKFTQALILGAYLKKTGDANLVEANPYDSYWGIGPDGYGQNMLGKLLMELRASLN